MTLWKLRGDLLFLGGIFPQATRANLTTSSYNPDGTTAEVDGGQTYRRTYTYDYAQRMTSLTTYGSSTATTSACTCDLANLQIDTEAVT